MERYTAEQLQNQSKEELIDMYIDLQNRALVTAGRLALYQENQFGSKSEKMSAVAPDDQINIFNEVEASFAEDTPEPTIEDVEMPEEPPKKKHGKKLKGKREKDLSKLPRREPIILEMTPEELVAKLGEGWIRLDDEQATVIRKIVTTPARHEVQEYILPKYTNKDHTKIITAPHPAFPLDNSIASASLIAEGLSLKFAYHMPMNRVSEYYAHMGLNISRNVLSSWFLRVTERFLSLLFERLYREMLKSRVIQADETFVRVTEEKKNSRIGKTVMWLYRTGEFQKEHPIILYVYQGNRSADHIEDFLGDWTGILVSDAYSGYKKVEKDVLGIVSAFCWAHAQRGYANELKIYHRDKISPEVIKNSLAYEGKQMIAKIYELEGREKKEPPDVRLKYRQENVKPLVDQYFKWCQEHQGEPLKDSETDKAINYSLNQEAYLKVFLVDGEVPIDNSASERAIKAIALGRKNWMIIDTIHGAEDTAICYSIVETAKANGLNPEKYFAKLLTTIPEHMDDKDTSFLDELLPWSDGIQATCRTDM